MWASIAAAIENDLERAGGPLVSSDNDQLHKLDEILQSYMVEAHETGPVCQFTPAPPSVRPSTDLPSEGGRLQSVVVRGSTELHPTAAAKKPVAHK